MTKKTARQLEDEIKRVVPRERTGRYAVRNLERPCVCGHTLGQHTAARVAGVQECLHEECPCMLFKKTRGGS